LPAKVGTALLVPSSAGRCRESSLVNQPKILSYSANLPLINFEVDFCTESTLGLSQQNVHDRIVGIDPTPSAMDNAIRGTGYRVGFIKPGMKGSGLQAVFVGKGKPERGGPDRNLWRVEDCDKIIIT
jgi:hypothetical protein